MDRPHYRRVSEEELEEARDNAVPPAKASKYSERLVRQFIVCGVVLAFILIINLFDGSRRVTAFISGVITNQPSVEDVMNDLSGVRQKLTMLFGSKPGPKADDITAATEAYAAYSSEEAADGNLPPSASATATPFRIDEDILAQMQSQVSGQ
jgi:hypothetical protein